MVEEYDIKTNELLGKLHHNSIPHYSLLTLLTSKNSSPVSAYVIVSFAILKTHIVSEQLIALFFCV